VAAAPSSSPPLARLAQPAATPPAAPNPPAPGSPPVTSGQALTGAAPVHASPAESDWPLTGSPPQNDKYRLIFLLASEGMDTASIAKHTNITRGEVEMLLDLRRQGKI